MPWLKKLPTNQPTDKKRTDPSCPARTDSHYIEQTTNTWVAAARIYYDLQRQGLTVTSSINCCIAQLAIESQLTLVHNLSDFDAIQKVRSVCCLRFQPTDN